LAAWEDRLEPPGLLAVLTQLDPAGPWAAPIDPAG